MTLTNTSDDALNVAGGITLGSNLAVNTDDLFVDTQAGRVGVGTTSPEYKLDVATTGNQSTSIVNLTGLRLYNDNYYAADTNEILFKHGSNAGQGQAKILSYLPGGNDVDMRFYTTNNTSLNTTPNLTLTGDGNNGIGTDSPLSKLHIDNGVLVVEDTPETNRNLLLPDGDGTGASLNEHIIGNTHVAVAQFVSEQEANTSTIAIINKDRDSNTTKNASIGFYNTDGVGTSKYAGRIGFWPNDINALENEFRVYTSNTVTYGAGYDLPQQRFVINKVGNVGIGTTNPDEKLVVNGGFQVGDWKTKTWYGNALASGQKDVTLITHDGTNSGTGVIKGEVTVMVHRGGFNQQNAYAKFHVGYSYWDSAWRGGISTIHEYYITGVSAIAMSTNGNSIIVSITGNDPNGASGDYYIKFEGPVFIGT
jgi:hypothetical protein